MDIRKVQLSFVISFFIILILLIGITYAYFIASISGTPTTDNVIGKSASPELQYIEGTTTQDSNILPGDTVLTKKFSVKNPGSASLRYSVILQSVVNNLSRKSDLVYTLSCSSGCNGSSEKPFPSTTSEYVLVTNSINGNTTQNYEFVLKYKNQTVDQVADSGSTFSGKINIKGSY